MYPDFYNEKNDFFSVIAASFLFHFAIIATLLIMIWLRPEKEKPPPIPFFELVNMAPPPPAPPEATRVPERPPEPIAPPPPPEPIAQPIPEPAVQPVPQPRQPEPRPLPPERPVPTPPAAVPTPTPPTEVPTPTPPPMEMPMDLPKDIRRPDMEMPALRTLGTVAMDPQMQEYLNRLLRLIYQNFNPPAGTEIAQGTRSSVQFQIARNGEINEVILRTSSGNSVWDRLAMRAIQITKPPPLPPSYAAESLPLIFDFRER